MPINIARAAQASFKFLREDKPPKDISLEMSMGSISRTDTDIAGVKLTHPERILWAEPGITNQGLADFYADIADWILPHVSGRVWSLSRCPSGTGGKCFFAKHPWHRLPGAGGAEPRSILGIYQPRAVAADFIPRLSQLAPILTFPSTKAKLWCR